MQYSAESLCCHRPLNVTILRTSRSLDWTSLLIEHHRVEPDQHEFETHPTPDQSIVVQISGETDVECFAGGAWRRALYQAGTIGLTPGGQSDRLRRRARARSQEVRKANLYLPRLLFEEAFDDLRQAGQRASALELNRLAFRDTALVNVVCALLGAIDRGAPDLYAAGAAHWLAVHLLCFHAGQLQPEGACLSPAAVSDRRIARVLELMAARLAEPLSLDELAREAGVSRFHFVRLFRDKTGMTPFSLLRRLRLEAARSIIASTDHDIGVVAGLVGFTRGAELARAFCSEYGMSPSAWRSGHHGVPR